MEWLSGKKTYILVVIGAITILIHFLTGEISFLPFVSSSEFTALLTLLGVGALRAGVSKAAPPVDPGENRTR